MQGRAIFKKHASDNATFAYREDGTLTTTTGQVLTVYKDYVYRYQNHKTSLYFPDDRHFHTLEFDQSHSPLKAHGRHL